MKKEKGRSAKTADDLQKTYMPETTTTRKKEIIYDENGKPTFDRYRFFSWSAISSFEYNPEQWYNKYVLNNPDPVSAEMIFGSKIGKQIEKDPTFLPEIPRETYMEYKFEATFEDIQLVGFADSFCPEKLVLHEYKTGVKAWDQKRVDEHGQIDMYLFMLYITQGIKPENVKCFLHWMPTTKKEKYEKGTGDLKVMIDFADPFEIKHFETKRTTRDILNFGVRIKKIWKEMEEYCKNHE